MSRYEKHTHTCPDCLKVVEHPASNRPCAFGQDKFSICKECLAKWVKAVGLDIKEKEDK
jgi:hypothetical protein